jgi:hypothetical protein
MKNKNTLIILLILPFILLFVLDVKNVAADSQTGLRISSPGAGEELVIGNTYTIMWTQNHVDRVKLSLYYSDSSEDFITTNNEDIQKTLEEGTGFYRWTIPSSIKAGDNVKIKAIAYHTGYESVTVFSGSFKIKAGDGSLPDLTITEAQLYKYVEGSGPGTGYLYDVKPKAGEQAFINVSVKNIGTKSLNGDQIVTYNVSGALVGSGTFSPTFGYALQSGMTDAFAYKIGELKSGTYKIIFSIDPENKIQELNETNNTYTFSFTVDSPTNSQPQNNQPQIVIISPKSGDIWSPGSTYEIKWTQTNVDKINIELWNKYTDGYSLHRNIISDYKVDIKNSTASYSWTIPNDPAYLLENCLIHIGAYHVGYGSVFVDSSSFKISKKTSDLPDLIITDVKTSHAVDPIALTAMEQTFFTNFRAESIINEGTGVGFLITIKNQGNTDTSLLGHNIGGLIVNLKNLQTNSSSNFGFDYCGVGSKLNGGPDIKPGESVVMKCGAYKNTNNLPTGNYQAKITVDPQNIIPESDASNNSFELNFSIFGKNQIINNNQTQTNKSATTLNNKNSENNNVQHKDPALAKRLKGKLLLQTEQGGAIWYVDDVTNQKHNITWNNALPIFQKYAIGISDIDLLKITASVESIDPDLDTDNDGYKDQQELQNNYSPYIAGGNKLKIDKNLANKLKGKFLLQVNRGGAIWYVDQNGIRHNVRWSNLMDLFKKLALGITNSNLDKIQVGD